MRVWRAEVGPQRPARPARGAMCASGKWLRGPPAPAFCAMALPPAPPPGAAGAKKGWRAAPQPVGLWIQFVTTPTPAIAVIDGSLCRLSRRGTVVTAHSPLATAVLEFLPGPMRFYVRENAYGLLPGVANLYCVDADFRLLWLAEWPLPEDPCGRLVEEVDGELLVESVNGALLRFDATTGRVLACIPRMAAAI